MRIPKKITTLATFATRVTSLAVLPSGAMAAAGRVIVVSVDGLRPAAIETLGAAGAPTFHRLQAEGAWTHNARADYDWTLTSANHATLVTGRTVEGDAGHNYTTNSTPAPSTTFHSVKGSYVASFFDVAHDHGLKTAYYYSKSKLAIIDQSYTATSGTEDMTGADDGRDKIDVAKANTDSTSDEITATYIADLPDALFDLTLLHLIDPDPAGHGTTWETQGYLDAVAAADSYLTDLLAAIDADPALAEDTVLIVVSDHGGGGGGPAGHGDATAAANYTIPFYVWGAGIAAGADLYALNALNAEPSRADPGTARIADTAAIQPIRNGDVANLALGLLGLPPVPGSTINTAQDLEVAAPTGDRFDIVVSLDGDQVRIGWDDLGAAFTYTVEINDGAGWGDAPGNWPSAATTWTDPTAILSTRLYRVRADP